MKATKRHGKIVAQKPTSSSGEVYSYFMPPKMRDKVESDASNNTLLMKRLC